VLVFLPGFKEIQAVHEALLATPRFSAEPHRAWLLPLHSTLPPEDQRRVFERPPAGVRKVVLATNIAETSVTIDDVVFVVDCARMKEKRYDPARRMESLDDVLVSRANAKQRRGRAGRVRPGVAFHLNTSHSFDHVAEAHQQPEIRRVPLERLVLTIKALKYERCAAAVCEQLLEPPSRPAVLQALRMLVELDALELDGSTLGAGERLTPLGQHLATLPTDVRIGKFLLLGAIFGVADEALTIAAILSGRSPFLSPFDKREAADAAKRGFAVGQSDHLTILNAYNHFDGRSGGERFAFAREHFLSIRSLQTIAQLKRQLLELLSEAGFVPRGLRASGVERIGRSAGGSDGVRAALSGDPDAASRPDLLELELQSNVPLLTALLCAALYPQVILVTQPEAKGRAGKGGGKGGGAGAPKLHIREQEAPEPVPVALHPSSVNARATRFDSQYLVFAEKAPPLARTCTSRPRHATLRLRLGPAAGPHGPAVRPRLLAGEPVGAAALRRRPQLGGGVALDEGARRGPGRTRARRPARRAERGGARHRRLDQVQGLGPPRGAGAADPRAARRTTAAEDRVTRQRADGREAGDPRRSHGAAGQLICTLFSLSRGSRPATIPPRVATTCCVLFLRSVIHKCILRAFVICASTLSPPTRHTRRAVATHALSLRREPHTRRHPERPREHARESEWRNGES